MVIAITGRIDELDIINTPTKLKAYAAEVWGSEGDATPYMAMFNILGLSGAFTVHGIEGEDQYFDGISCGQPFDIVMLPKFTVFDVMSMAWAITDHRAWPHVDHVWFESLTIDTELRTLTFSMGS